MALQTIPPKTTAAIVLGLIAVVLLARYTSNTTTMYVLGAVGIWGYLYRKMTLSTPVPVAPLKGASKVAIAQSNYIETRREAPDFIGQTLAESVALQKGQTYDSTGLILDSVWASAGAIAQGTNPSINALPERFPESSTGLTAFPKVSAMPQPKTMNDYMWAAPSLAEQGITAAPVSHVPNGAAVIPNGTSFGVCPNADNFGGFS